MFRLRATLVATTVARPWRTGWSVDRGVDFSLTRATAGPPGAEPPDGMAPAEPPCFIEDDRGEGLRAFVSHAGPGPVADDAPEAGAVRAWWSLAGKPPRT